MKDALAPTAERRTEATPGPRPPRTRPAGRRISVVVPLYNENESLRELHAALASALDGTGADYEILYVDDGSDDGSSKTLDEIFEEDESVHVIHLRKNFGKSAAINAGFKEATGDHGADVILDMVGGDYIERNLRAAAMDGRIVQIAFLKGSKVEIDLMRLMMRRLTLTGSTLRAQSAEAKARMARASRESVRGATEMRAMEPLAQVVKVRPTMCTWPCVPGTSPGASTTCSWRVTTRAPKVRSRSFCAHGSAGSTSSISVTSRPPVALSRTCYSG